MSGYENTQLFVVLKNTRLVPKDLRTLATNTTGKLNILGHDGHTLGVNGTQVGIFKESNQVSFCSLLQGKHSRSLETKIRLKVLGNLTDQTLEWKLADQQVSRLLIATNFTEGHSARAVTVRLLDSSSGRG